MIALLQAAQTAAASSFGIHLSDAGIAAILAINAWQLRVTMQFRDDARALRQWAFGIEGGNGINGTVKEHGTRIDVLEDRRTGPTDRRHPE